MTQSATRAYNGAPLTAPGSISGLQPGDTVTFTTTGVRTIVGSSSNTYSIAWGSTLQSNYTISQTLGTLTVNPATLTITAASFVLVAGSPLPAFAYTATGFVGGQGYGIITGAPVYATGYTPDAAAGTVWNISINGLAAANYNIVYVLGTITVVAPGTFTVTFDPGTQGTFAAVTIAGLAPGSATPAAPDTPGNAGYVFAGWAPVVAATVTANVTYVAQWDTAPAETTTITQPPTPTTTITPDTVPLSGAGASWALINLILTVVGILLAIGLFIAYFSKRKEEETDDDEQVEQLRKKRMTWRIINLIAGVIAIVVFLLTEDITLPMALVDWWTICHVIIFILQIVFSVIATRKKKDEEEVENNYTVDGTVA